MVLILSHPVQLWKRCLFVFLQISVACYFVVLDYIYNVVYKMGHWKCRLTISENAEPECFTVKAGLKMQDSGCEYEIPNSLRWTGNQRRSELHCIAFVICLMQLSDWGCFIFICHCFTTLCLKKVPTFTLCITLPQNLYNITQLILGMLLHYLGKLKSQFL